MKKEVSEVFEKEQSNESCIHLYLDFVLFYLHIFGNGVYHVIFYHQYHLR